MLKVKHKQSVVDFCFYLSIAVLPFTLILTPIALGLLVVVFLVFGEKTQFMHRFKGKISIWILVGLYLLHMLGLLLSIELGFDFSRINTQLLLLLIPLIFLSLNLKLEHIYKAKEVYIISCVIFCILALITLIYNLIINYEHRLDYNFVQTSMYHYHYPYDVLYINIACIMLLFNSYFRPFKLQASILFFIFIFLSGTRIGLASFVFITAIYFFKNFKQFKNFKAVAFFIGMIIFSIILIKNSRYVNDKFFDTLSKIGFNTEQYVSEIGEEYHKVTLRQKLWSSAKEAYNDSLNKIFGYGPEGSREVLNNIYEKNKYSIKGMNSHNQYLTTLLNNGIVGVLILFIIFFLGLRFGVAMKSTQIVLLTTVIIIAFTTESMLERQKGVAIFTVVFTLVFLESYLTKKELKQLK
jgi:O-antigen ligase